MRYNGAGCTMAVTGPAPCSVGARVVMTCGWLGEPGQNGQCWSAPRRPSSSPTMTHERVIGSLRSSMTPKSITEMKTHGGAQSAKQYPPLFDPYSYLFAFIRVNSRPKSCSLLSLLAILAIPDSLLVLQLQIPMS